MGGPFPSDDVCRSGDHIILRTRPADVFPVGGHCCPHLSYGGQGTGGVNEKELTVFMKSAWQQANDKTEEKLTGFAGLCPLLLPFAIRRALGLAHNVAH